MSGYLNKGRLLRGLEDCVEPKRSHADLWEKVRATARALERLGLEWEIALRASRSMHRGTHG